MNHIFYGWWIVAACLIVAVVGWSLGTFGIGVYLHTLSNQGFSISLVSMALTLSSLVSAASLIAVSRATAHFGPKPIVAAGALIMAPSVAGVAFCTEVWHIFLVFLVMGLGRSCLSTTSISTTLAPWFERHQGRAISIALLGASIGGIIATPLLLGGMTAFGVETTMILAGASSIVILIPLAVFVLKHRPQDIGLLPDGEPIRPNDAPKIPAAWSRTGAMATRQFQTQLIAFGLGLMVQVGFLSHHVSLATSSLSETGASIAVSAAALSAFIGRIALARYADRLDLRLTAGGVFTVAALSLISMALFSGPIGLMTTSVIYGLTVGNVTTLSPIIARREFGAASFGVVFGVAASAISFATAMGPVLYGVLRDAFGSYGPVLLIAGILNMVAAIVIVWGGREPLPDPT